MTGSRSAVSQLAAGGALFVVIVFLSIVSPDFLTADNLFNVGSQVAYTAVMAIGVTLVIITAGIDLSVGSVAALSGVLGVMMMGGPGTARCLWGSSAAPWSGRGRARERAPVSVAGLNPFIATLGMLTVAGVWPTS